MTPPDLDRLESLIHRTLRSLPDRPAPRTLEARVTAALDRQADLPWWRRSFSRWPQSARYGVFATAAASAALLVLFSRGPFATRAFGALAEGFPWIVAAQSVGAGLLETGRSVATAIPPTWIYGAAILLTGCYALLIGLGAAVYRTFYRRRPALAAVSP
jgi:hypothetical protein